MKVASELKTGSVMDILGKSDTSSTESKSSFDGIYIYITIKTWYQGSFIVITKKENQGSFIVIALCKEGGYKVNKIDALILFEIELFWLLQ